jgi:hypothetical protein
MIPETDAEKQVVSSVLTAEQNAFEDYRQRAVDQRRKLHAAVAAAQLRLDLQMEALQAQKGALECALTRALTALAKSQDAESAVLGDQLLQTTKAPGASGERSRGGWERSPSVCVVKPAGCVRIPALSMPSMKRALSPKRQPSRAQQAEVEAEVSALVDAGVVELCVAESGELVYRMPKGPTEVCS